MKRYVRKAGFWASVSCCAVTLAMSVVSLSRPFYWIYDFEGNLVEVENGAVAASWGGLTSPVHVQAPGWYMERTPPAFAWRLRSGSGFVSVPLWMPLLVGVLGVYWLRAPRPMPGQCPECGYDLRGIPRAPDGSLKCPECGTPA